METRKLYYEDCHLAAFSAQVLSCEESAKGWQIVLDATAFYPEGGGQACDLGTLNGVRVLDVREKDERVVHLCDGPLSVGERVEGVIDYERRFDLMQQHSGEHIVSGIIHQRFGYHNVGFHMGADLVTIDFDGPIPADELASIELEANRAVWANLNLHIWYPAEEELPHVGYRSKRALPWPVRVVEVPGYDKCACCGTHVAQTGEIGIIKLFSCVKFHEGVRIEMACGGRALRYLTAAYEQNRQVSQAFSAKIMETGEAARRMNEQLAAEKFRAAGLQKQVFASVAAGCRDVGNVLRFEQDLTPVQIRELCDAIGEVCGGMAAVFSGNDETGYSYCLMERGGDLRSINKAMTVALNGRGGGKPEYQQGSVKADRATIEGFFKENGV